MRRDYETEVVEYLKTTPSNAVVMSRALSIRGDKMHTTLLKLEEAGRVKWLPTSETDGVWQVQKPRPESGEEVGNVNK